LECSHRPTVGSSVVSSDLQPLLRKGGRTNVPAESSKWQAYNTARTFVKIFLHSPAVFLSRCGVGRTMYSQISAGKFAWNQGSSGWPKPWRDFLDTSLGATPLRVLALTLKYLGVRKQISNTCDYLPLEPQNSERLIKPIWEGCTS
jgi:hypothetical protein